MDTITIVGKNKKKRDTWVSITGVPAGGHDDRRFLMTETPDGSCLYQQISPRTNELLIIFLDALKADQDQFGRGFTK